MRPSDGSRGSKARRGLLLCLTLGAVACSAQRGGEDARNTALTTAERGAVHAAEEFVLTGGYTDAPAQPDGIRRSPELEDHLLTPEQVAALRHNSLKPHAYGIFRGARGRPDGWTVVFEFSDEWIAQTAGSAASPAVGRAVTMDSRLAELRLEHVDVRLDAVQKRVTP